MPLEKATQSPSGVNTQKTHSPNSRTVGEALMRRPVSLPSVHDAEEAGVQDLPLDGVLLVQFQGGIPALAPGLSALFSMRSFSSPIAYALLRKSIPY